LWVIVPIRIVLFFLLIISWNQGSKSKPSTEEV
jgi:hypothetical protein